MLFILLLALPSVFAEDVFPSGIVRVSDFKCAGSNIELSCPDQAIIVISYALYFPLLPGYLCAKDNNCQVKSYFEHSCNRVSKCNIPATTYSALNNCRRMLRAMQVIYSCVPAEPSASIPEFHMCQAHPGPILDKEGFIYSHPNFGGANYDNFLQCQLTIHVPEGHRILLYQLHFDLEETGFITGWIVDYLQINGRQKFYGRDKPPALILNSTDDTHLSFVTDVSHKYDGFWLYFKVYMYQFVGTISTGASESTGITTRTVATEWASSARTSDSIATQRQLRSDGVAPKDLMWQSSTDSSTNPQTSDLTMQTPAAYVRPTDSQSPADLHMNQNDSTNSVSPPQSMTQSDRPASTDQTWKDMTIGVVFGILLVVSFLFLLILALYLRKRHELKAIKKRLAQNEFIVRFTNQSNGPENPYVFDPSAVRQHPYQTIQETLPREHPPVYEEVMRREKVVVQLNRAGHTEESEQPCSSSA